jgi:hypothetical protein
MRMQSYSCKCALHPEGHLVRKSNKVVHLLEVQQRLARQVRSLVLMPAVALLTHALAGRVSGVRYE